MCCLGGHHIISSCTFLAQTLVRDGIPTQLAHRIDSKTIWISHCLILPSLATPPQPWGPLNPNLKSPCPPRQWKWDGCSYDSEGGERGNGKQAKGSFGDLQTSPYNLVQSCAHSFPFAELRCRWKLQYNQNFNLAYWNQEILLCLQLSVSRARSFRACRKWSSVFNPSQGQADCRRWWNHHASPDSLLGNKLSGQVSMIFFVVLLHFMRTSYATHGERRGSRGGQIKSRLCIACIAYSHHPTIVQFLCQSSMPESHHVCRLHNQNLKLIWEMLAISSWLIIDSLSTDNWRLSCLWTTVQNWGLGYYHSMADVIDLVLCSSGVIVSPKSGQRPTSAAGSTGCASTIMVDGEISELPSNATTPRRASRRNSLAGEFAEWQLL